ncbi:MAG: DUF2628 domain-containing protein [Candidatus Adiutrix sp.]|jgi:hypothetical protein|nr:DUF2628 domain-containing protein [Candidatus Adiutrix sp.]
MAFVERPQPPSPDGEPPLRPWQVGLVEYDQEQLRKAYVGEKYEEFFADLFDRIEDEERFQPVFIWPPLVFGCFWFFYRRMYREGILFFLVSYGIRRALSLPPLGDWLVWLLINAAMAMGGAWLYFQKTERQTEKALFEFGNDPPLVTSWLIRHGGVDNRIMYVAAAVILLKLYFTFLVVLGAAIGMGVSR